MRFRSWWAGGSATGEVELDLIELVQRAVSDPPSVQFTNVVAAVHAIVVQQLWSLRVAVDGAAFTSFPAFAIAKAPHGLGMRCEEAARLVRHALFERQLFGAWGDLLEVIARKRGGHQPIITDSDELRKFYTVSRSPTSRDRLLLALKHKHPDVYQKRICEEGCSPYNAAIEVGLIVTADKSRMRYGVCDLEAAQRLRPKVQGALLRDVFRALGLDAQCELLALELDPKLGPGLAKRWRNGRD